MSRANVRVRPATPDDLSALVTLIRLIDPSTGALSGKTADPADATDERQRARMREMLDGADRSVLVAVDESDDLAGLLIARTDEVGAIDLTPVLHVSHLMVLPSQRRRGIGRALLAAAVHLADDAGVENVLSTAAAGSRESNRYLARLGFAPLVVHRIAPTSVLRRSLGMTDVAGRMAVLRRARMGRSQRGAFPARAVGRGA